MAAVLQPAIERSERLPCRAKITPPKIVPTPQPASNAPYPKSPASRLTFASATSTGMTAV